MDNADASSICGPIGMVAVDHEDMDVSVSIADTLRVSEVRVVLIKVVVDVLDLVRIVRRPEPCGG